MLATREAFGHGRTYEFICEKYLDIMKFRLNRNIDLRETGLVSQLKLFWFAASPEGLVSDKTNEDSKIRLIEIRCPKSNLRKIIRSLTWYMINYSMLNTRMEYQYYKKIIQTVTTHKYKWQWNFLK